MKPLRVGLMVPGKNTTMEAELLKWMPPGTNCRTIKIPRGAGLLTWETVPAYKAKALELARGFVESELDAVVYGCTAAGFIYGPRCDAQLAAQLAQITGKPVVTTARAMVDALEHSGASDVAGGTPYGGV